MIAPQTPIPQRPPDSDRSAPQRQQARRLPPRNDSDESLGFPPPGTGSLLTCALVVGFATLLVMLWPFNFQSGAGDMWLSIAPVAALAIIANIALFMPLGFIEGWLAHHTFGRHAGLVLLAVVDVALLSLIGESLQLLLPTRASSMLDLVANTLGGAIGAVAGDLLAPRLSARFLR